MKVWFRSIAVFFVIALAPISATAQSTEGFYASIGGLYVLPSESSGSYQEGDWKLTGTVPLESGPGFVAAVGFETTSGLRGEIELGYRSSSWDKYENLNLTFEGDSVASGDLDLGGDVDTISIMVNGIMVFDDSWGVRPYLGLGLGFAQHDASTDAFTVTVDGDVYEFESDSSDDTVIAYQVMLGVAYPLSEMSEARIGYRYFGTGEADFDGSKFDYGSHNIEAGILFRF